MKYIQIPQYFNFGDEKSYLRHLAFVDIDLALIS